MLSGWYALSGLFQFGTGGLIVALFFWLIPRGFSHIYDQPEDRVRPFKLQRVRIRNDGEESDFIPRINIWAGLVITGLMAACWLVVYHHFGVLT